MKLNPTSKNCTESCDVYVTQLKAKKVVPQENSPLPDISFMLEITLDTISKERMAFVETHKELQHSHVFLCCIKRLPGGVYVWFTLDVTTSPFLA